MAVITVSPTTDISALIASDNVSPGDAILLEDGEYFQTVNVTKDYLRIVAKGKKAVFDGKGILVHAFMLNDVTGVSIMHYRSDAFRIELGGAHRIVGNKINGVLGNGIFVITSAENLLWKNEICNALDGVQLISAGVNNHIIENLVTLCEDDGFECFGEVDSNNVFAGNIAINNGGFGLEISGSNNLLMDNILIGNRLGGMRISVGNNSVAIGNLILNSRSRGGFLDDHTNCFFGENKVEANHREGATLLGEFINGIIQENVFRHNTDTGITLGPETDSNFIFNEPFAK